MTFPPRPIRTGSPKGRRSTERRPILLPETATGVIMKKTERAGVPAKVRMSEKSLLEIFSRLDGQISMHMPGHKRDLDEFPWLGMPLGKCDVTEISGFDDLYAPEGVLADILARLAALWGSRRAFLSVNGSTGAVFAALSLAGRNGVLAARNCHRSVFAAVKELGIRTEYVFPRTVSGRGFLGSVSPEDIAARLDETGCGAVVVTSPTYEGVMSDIAGIARAAHERGAVLIVDCAHGAHLGLSDAFPDGGVREGADIVVSSLHKTLPALTQTAVMHVCSDRVDADAAAEEIAAFCTSSPSYALMASVDGMLGYLEKKGSERLRFLADELASFRRRLTALAHLEVFDGGGASSAEIYRTDSSKIYIDCTKCDLSGYALKATLRDRFGIELESASCGGALAYATVGDERESFLRLAEALESLDAECAPAEGKVVPAPVFGEKTAEIAEVGRAPSRLVPLRDAVGKIAAESVWVYPPGVPVLLPGERVTGGAASYLAEAEAMGASVAAARGAARGNIRVLA